MKLQFISISVVLILLFFSPNSKAATSDSVYDTDRQALIPGEQYYVLPVIRGQGGGLVMILRNETCPENVAQKNTVDRLGLPLIFLPENPKDGVVRLSTDLNIAFAAVSSCIRSTVWQLGKVVGAARKHYVFTGGVIGNPGPETVSTWFKIEKWGNKGYKLVFCPSVCKTCKVVCGDVGVYEGEERLLGLSDAPFPVMFKRKDSDF